MTARNTREVELPVADLAELITRRELSSHEVVLACLERMDTVSPRLNALVQLRADAALAEADAADALVADGAVRGPLHGVPSTVKDWIDATGLPEVPSSSANVCRLETQRLSLACAPRAAFCSARVDWQDPSVIPVPLPEMAEAHLPGTRVALYLDHPGFEPHPEIVEATRAAALALADAGLDVEELLPAGVEDVYPITLGYWRRPESDSADEWVKGGISDPAGLGPMLNAEAVECSLFEWDRLRRRMLPFIATYPLVLSPDAQSVERVLGDGYRQNRQHSLFTSDSLYVRGVSASYCSDTRVPAVVIRANAEHFGKHPQRWEQNVLRSQWR